MNYKLKIKDFISNNILYFLDFKNKIFKTFKKIYYSQTGEDVILSQIFKNKKNGFYVDVGAYHPVHYSNTKIFYDKGWTGINIDPNPDTIYFFNKQRSKDININIGISGKEESLNYYTFSHPSCNTFSADFFNKIKSKSWIKHLKTISVECKPLSWVFDKYIKDNQDIDILSVDVEGYDLEVLDSNNWLKYKPKVLVVEAHDFNFEHMNDSKLYNFITNKGYSLYASTGLSLIFKRSQND